MVDEDIVSWTWQRLGQAKDRPGRLRLAEALLALEWPDKDAVSERDSYRSLAIERRLAAGETASAAQLLREIVTPDMLARMAAARKYDALFPEGGDRVALIRQSLGRYDEATRRRLAAAPADPKRLLERGNALRALGRDAEAAALLLPFATDLAKVEAAGEDGFWVVNEAAAALGAVGRHAEAVALMEKLLALGVDTHSGLISMAINHGEVLLGAGRFADAAAHEAKLSQGAKTASPYGYMWMWSMAACGHALGGDAAGAQPWLAKLAANSADNEAAHMRALLCANDMNGAEKLLVARLKGDDPESMLAKLQTYEQGTSPSAAAKVIEPRLLALRDRPAVREAIADVGRILSLPLSKTYFGDY
jgi:tetratricopeptide (TPR) repeat protein